MSHIAAQGPARQAGPTSVEELAHTDVSQCYQCGKCSAGCPMAEKMDVLPNRLIRLVQRGEIAKAAASEAVWLCVSCLTCTTRCPKSVDCAAVMDALRQIAVEKDLVAPTMRRTVFFQREFLRNIKRNGRLNELSLVMRFKLGAFLRDRSVPLLMKDSLLAPRMYKRGKLHLRSRGVRDLGVVERIFERCQE
jgi:heterodisulfide reductase subunit C2